MAEVWERGRMGENGTFHPTIARRAALAASCSLFALTPAEAQQAETARVFEGAAELPEEVPAGEAAPSNEGVQDIIVTARRRPEPLQLVPVSVVAFTARDLDARSVTNTRSLQNLVPNLTFAPSQNVGEAAGNIFIRGIGQEDFGIGAEPGVALYVDGVYFPRSLGTIMNLIDVDRIEVLRGPQGTTFGKNAIGGVINIISAAPRAGREHETRVILGNYDRIEL